MASHEEQTGGMENVKKEELPNSWSIRPCEIYKEEYSDCTSFKARFHQYFIFGKSVDCSQWKRDHDSCIRYEEKKDLKSGKELVNSETIRRLERFKQHNDNDIWSKRDKPPDNWSDPLPDWLQKEYESSFLAIKAKELNGDIPTAESARTLCSIM